MLYTAQKSVYLLWPGLGSEEKTSLNTEHVRERNIIENPHFGRLCALYGVDGVITENVIYMKT